jgi:hypothetical protein
MVALGIMTALIAAPQLLLLNSGGAKTSTHPFLHWGYVIDQPTLAKVIAYMGFSFGLKIGLSRSRSCLQPGSSFASLLRSAPSSL